MNKLRVPCEKATESPPSARSWSASTTCEVCGEYKPCRCAAERNLCRTLVFLAAWKSCRSCSARVLYVDEQARTDSEFICGRCDERREAMGKRLSRPSLPLRMALHLRSLFSTANDNHEVTNASA